MTLENKPSKISATRLLAYLALSITLLIIGAIIKIPFAVPMTLQFATAMLITFVLGEYSILAMAIYLIMGLCGLPIFALGGGISYLLQPSFGYLIGFLISCPICGKIINPQLSNNRATLKRAIIAFILQLLIVYAIGACYHLAVYRLYLHSTLPLGELLLISILSTIWKDLLLGALMLPVGIKLQRVVGLKK